MTKVVGITGYDDIQWCLLKESLPYNLMHVNCKIHLLATYVSDVARRMVACNQIQKSCIVISSKVKAI